MSQDWNQPPGGSPPGGGYGAPPGGPPPGGYGAPPAGGPPAGGYGAPPPGGYGAPPPGAYGPAQPWGMQPAPAPVEGNLALGILAGFFGGCIGLILVYAIAKGHQTKRGAGIGFAAQIAFGLVLRIVAR